MSDFPEDPKEAEKYLKERMETVMPELKWCSDRPLRLFRARGYKDGKKAFSQEKISIGIWPERDGATVVVHDPDYYSQGEELERRIASGNVLGQIKAGITRDY